MLSGNLGQHVVHAGGVVHVDFVRHSHNGMPAGPPNIEFGGGHGALPALASAGSLPGMGLRRTISRATSSLCGLESAMAAITHAQAVSGSLGERAALSLAMPSSMGLSRRSTSPSVYRQSMAPGGNAMVVACLPRSTATPISRSETIDTGSAGGPRGASTRRRGPPLGGGKRSQRGVKNGNKKGTHNHGLEKG